MIKLNTKSIHKIIVISATALLVGFMGFYFYSLYNQEIKVLPVNVGAQSFSVAWTTSSPTKGCVVVMPNKKILKTKIVCHKKDKSPVHLEKFTLVLPDTQYSIWVINGLRVSAPKTKTLKTFSISEKQPNIPEPAYGMVVNPYKSRATNALVVLTAQTPTFQYPLATLSGPNGTFTLDLNGFSQKPDGYRLEATHDGIIWNNRYVSADVTAPMPPITVTLYVK